MLKLTDQNIGGYERVVRATDETTGLDACIAVHNTQLGPAIGGCRYYAYKDFDQQRYDAMRLSKSMTYKNALTGLHNGGGKTTINANTGKKTLDLWKSFAEALNKLDGIYYTAGDIGTNTQDLAELHKHTQFVLGYEGEDSGWATAYGVYNAMRGAFRRFISDTEDLNRSIVIIGLGKVGSRLVHFLQKDEFNYTIHVTDLDKENYSNLLSSIDSSNTKLHWHNTTEDINLLTVDVYAPCAIGGTITREFAQYCRAKIICGGANNQLENDEVAQILLDRNILYVPDYLANSGGVMQVRSSYNMSHDITSSLNITWDNPLVKDRLENIGTKVFDILSLSQEQNKPTNIVAKEIVEKKLKNL